MILPEINWTPDQCLEFFGLPKDTKVAFATFPPPSVKPYEIYLEYYKPYGDFGNLDVSAKIMHRNFMFTAHSFDRKFPSHFDICPAHNLITISFIKNGKYHNETNNPAIMQFKDKTLRQEEYYLNGNRHNSTGPALRIIYNKIWYNYYYIHGVPIERSIFFDKYNCVGNQ